MSTQTQFIANGKSLLQSAGTTLRYLGAQIEHAVSRKWGFLKAEITSSWHLVQQLSVGWGVVGCGVKLGWGGRSLRG